MKVMHTVVLVTVPCWANGRLHDSFLWADEVRRSLSREIDIRTARYTAGGEENIAQCFQGRATALNVLGDNQHRSNVQGTYI